MKSCSEIKRIALGALANNWGSAVGTTAVFLGITLGASILIVAAIYIIALAALLAMTASGIAVGALGGLTPSMLTGPMLGLLLTVFSLALVGELAIAMVSGNLTIGQCLYHVNLTSGRKASVSDIFLPMRRRFFKSFGVVFMTQLKAALWMFAGFIPGYALMVCSIALANVSLNPANAAILFTVGLIIMLAGLIPYYMAVLRYSMAPLLFAENPDIGVFGSINRSKELMRGHKGELFVLQLSFIGWYILAYFTFFIGYLFLIPYIVTAECVFFNELLGRPTADNSASAGQAHNGYGSTNYGSTNYSNTNYGNTGNSGSTPQNSSDSQNTAQSAPGNINTAPLLQDSTSGDSNSQKEGGNSNPFEFISGSVDIDSIGAEQKEPQTPYSSGADSDGENKNI